MRRAGRLTAAILVVGAAVAMAAPAPAADAIRVKATPIALDPEHPGHVAVGRLVFRGGLVLESDDARFGGWSDLHVSADGTKLVGLSDNGFWLTAQLGYDHGRLAGLAEAKLGPLIDPAGARLMREWADSEGLARRPDGAFYVSFERHHRVLLYPAADPPFSARPQPIPMPARLATAPWNGGIEALGWLSGGSLLALVESLLDQGEHVGWVGADDGSGWQELHYRTGGRNYAPTGIAQLPPGTTHAGDVLVLEREFTIFHGRAARIVRLARTGIRAGAHLTGAEVAHLRQPLTLDNFEGIAAIPGPDGSARVYIISDDNYMVLQRTLLFMFEYR